MGMGVFEGRVAVRGFYLDWMGAYEDYRIEAEEIHDLGNGVTFGIVVQEGRLREASARSGCATATCTEWVDGKAVRVWNYTDIDEAVLPPNTSRRSGDRRCPRTSTSCARSTRTGNAETSVTSSGRTLTSSGLLSMGFRPVLARGIPAMSAGWREFVDDWSDFRSDAEEYRELDDERVLVLHIFSGRGRTSGVEVGPTGARGACLFHVSDRKVTKLLLYSVRDRALADLGLEE